MDIKDIKSQNEAMRVEEKNAKWEQRQGRRESPEAIFGRTKTVLVMLLP